MKFTAKQIAFGVAIVITIGGIVFLATKVVNSPVPIFVPAEVLDTLGTDTILIQD